MTLTQIAGELDKQGISTPRGGIWTATAVRRALARMKTNTPRPTSAAYFVDDAPEPGEVKPDGGEDWVETDMNVIETALRRARKMRGE